MMTDKYVCDRIHSLYADFRQWGENLDVRQDENNHAWAVDFVYWSNKIRHYLDNEDAAICENNDQCLSLGIDFGQFR